MSSNLLKRIGISASALTAVVFAAGILTSPTKADEYDKKTLLTVDQPTQVFNTYLEPGTYMFRLLDWDRHIVELATQDRKRVLNIILAIPAYRVNVTGEAQFTFWETPPGTPKAVRKWFYPGDHDGWEFRYPTKWQQVAAVAVAPAPAPPPISQPAVTAPPAPEAEAAPAPPVQQAPPPPQAPVEIAQNTPPPEVAQNNPPPAPEPASQAEPQPLPKTASPYPLFGLGGLLALGLYTMLRVTRTSGQNG
jgi:hypothetical protein